MARRELFRQAAASHFACAVTWSRVSRLSSWFDGAAASGGSSNGVTKILVRHGVTRDRRERREAHLGARPRLDFRSSGNEEPPLGYSLGFVLRVRCSGMKAEHIHICVECLFL
jgi:hypothetical protein